MNGIKTDFLDNMKTQILANTTLCYNFSQCVVLYKYCITQTKASKKPNLNISSFTSGQDKKGNEKYKFGEVEDYYYATIEYQDLSPDQKKG